MAVVMVIVKSARMGRLGLNVGNALTCSDTNGHNF